MMNISTQLHLVGDPSAGPAAAENQLDVVFFALSDPLRRRILERLDGPGLLVSGLAAPFAISLQAVSRQIAGVVRAGIMQPTRNGRITRCSLDLRPLLAADDSMNRDI